MIGKEGDPQMRISLPCLAAIAALTAVAQDQPVTPGNGITVRGHVIKPGVYPFVIHNTIKMAIGESGGLMNGWREVAYIYRIDSEGVSQKIEIPLGKILRRQSPDIELQPGDVLDVPTALGIAPKNRPTIIDVPISRPGAARS
jgi:hypothetical protein